MRNLVFVFAVVPLAGCGLELLGTTAIRSTLEVENAKVLERQLDRTHDFSHRITVEQAIAAYHAEKGRYPASLETLVQEGYLPQTPVKPDGSSYGYDPATGRLLDGPVTPSRAPTPAPVPLSQGDDTRAMQQIRIAILDYWKETRAYPPSLNALTPKYLASVPRSVSGQDFVYDPNTGAVHAPPALPSAQPAYPSQPTISQQPARRTPVVSGGGPMAEVMTGIGIQQELSNMSNAGVSAAASRARQNARSVGQQHDQRQQQVIDDLGL